MTVREMHIEINQSLQKIASNSSRKFFSEEIDWILNKIVGEFIQQRLTPKSNGSYAINELYTDALRPLIKEKELVAYIKSKNSYEAYLPADYSYLLADGSNATQLCGATPTTVQTPLTINWVKQVLSQRSTAPYYATYLITANGKTVDIPTDLPYNHAYVGYQSKKDIDLLIPYLHQKQLEANINVYWEKLHKTKQGYWAYIDTPTQLAIDTDPLLTVDQEILALTKHSLPTISTDFVANRLESSANVIDLLSTAFYKASSISPISELVGNSLIVYNDNSFIVTVVKVKYIAKPSVISLSLGSDCNLASEFHQSICNLAVEYIKSRLENTTAAQLAERHNDKRTIN